MPDAHRVPVLVVVAGSKNWAIPVVHVIESMRLPRVEAITGAPSFLLGLTVIRGESVPVVQLGSLFGDVGKATSQRLVSLRVGQRTVAIAVAAVVGVADLDMATMAELPPLLREARLDAVEAIGVRDDELLLVLRATRLVPEAVWGALAKRQSS